MKPSEEGSFFLHVNAVLFSLLIVLSTFVKGLFAVVILLFLLVVVPYLIGLFVIRLGDSDWRATGTGALGGGIVSFIYSSYLYNGAYDGAVFLTPVILSTLLCLFGIYYLKRTE